MSSVLVLLIEKAVLTWLMDIIHQNKKELKMTFHTYNCDTKKNMELNSDRLQVQRVLLQLVENPRSIIGAIKGNRLTKANPINRTCV
jgi:hypothetical protein